MAERESDGSGPQLDIRQILSEAQHRWLRTAEICEILRNYEKLCITSEPPNRPPSGSFLLFNRKVMRHFRNDGHNWGKKKDGKTVKEGHEKLRVGRVEMLHCYYAHGEENNNFQRRSYWMIEQDLAHIVFVHYLEVKGNRTNIGGIRESDQVAPDFQDSPMKSSLCRSTDSPNPISSPTSLCEDADSKGYQAWSRSHSFLLSLPIKTGPLTEVMDASASSSYFPSPSADNHGISSMPGVNYISHVQKARLGGSDDITDVTFSQKTCDIAYWEEASEQSTSGFHTSVPAPMGILHGHENMILHEHLAGGSVENEEIQNSLLIQPNWQTFDDNSAQLPMWLMGESSNLELTYDFGMTSFEAKTHDMNLGNASEPFSTYAVQQNEQPGQNKLQIQLANDESQCSIRSNSKTDMLIEGIASYALTLKKSLLDGEEALKKVDSFSRWVTKELGDVDDLHLKNSSGISWSTDECGNVVDDSSLSPFLSEDQLFSILDFLPKWAYTDSETEVLITGTFLKSLPDVVKCNWSCMFGEVEVPAEILANGVLCCSAPPHAVGQVPFYVTCSNRLACSEVREFDYRVGSTKDIDIAIIYGGTTNEMLLYLRLKKLLSLRSISPPSHFVEGVAVKLDLISKIISLKEEEKYYQMVETTSQKDLSQHEGKEHLLKMLMKEKLYSWLLHKVSEDGKGPSVLDDEGQGVIHLAAALGYDWAIKPIVTAEVSINFCDINGWTALHWAAFCGREHMVAFLVSLGAAPQALTDPSPEFLLGRTPADLASGNGHERISYFLAESSLTDYLKSLTINDPKEDETVEVSGLKVVQTVLERTAAPVIYGDAADAPSLRDSLTALCNAKQAFLIICLRIAKIQAHVRGHQVRKQYRTIVWSVGILEKVILRWRRKRIGLRGFRPDAHTKDLNAQSAPSTEDDYDFLKEGRKQTVERLRKDLTMVTSMAENPEGRAQYRRLLTTVEGFRQTKGGNTVWSRSEETADVDEDLIDIGPLLEDDMLLNDDNFMS